jgi:GxxExxY protein
MTEIRDPLTHEIIGAAIEVHRNLGPGVLESAFEACLCFELAERGLSVERQVGMPLIYKGVKLNIGYRPDLIVNGAVIVELKSVDRLITQHEAQVLTYLKLSGLETGLLINIQSQPLIKGIKRLVRSASAVSAVSA